MKKNTLFWITGIVLLAALLLFVPSMLMFGRGNWMHDGGYNMMDGYNTGPGSSMMGDYGYNMMGGGRMAFGWIIPIAILILVIAAGVWLGNTLSSRSKTYSSPLVNTCSNCKKPTNADWKTCPYCSTSL